MGSDKIAALWKAPAKCCRNPDKNASTKAKKEQAKDNDAYPYVARARPKLSTIKKGTKAPPSDNSTKDKSSASESHFYPQQ
jgi:hypothetical protein